MIDQVSNRVRNDRAISRGRNFERGKSSSEVRTLPRTYRDRSPLHTMTSVELDGLIERLGDARIGLLNDEEVDDLLNRVSKI